MFRTRTADQSVQSVVGMEKETTALRAEPPSSVITFFLCVLRSGTWSLFRSNSPNSDHCLVLASLFNRNHIWVIKEACAVCLQNSFSQRVHLNSVKQFPVSDLYKYQLHQENKGCRLQGRIWDFPPFFSLSSKFPQTGWECQGVSLVTLCRLCVRWENIT